MVFIGLVIRAKLNPPPEMRHASATEVTGYETVSTEKKNLSGGLVVSKVFIGPVVDRPQDRVVSPGATLHDMGRPGEAGAYWLAYGDYADGCHISVDRVVGGDPLRRVSELSNSQRDEVSRGEKLVLVAKFACGEG
ncbi:hypothetical protein [Nocardia lijiangensis]|uniref:hypothetical protein n=1 Tax=Nocardia lijiangensis TaxID=299618 RepID=UPI00082B3CA5|nr:hypothetical protein [Nocardia lijiangensis]